MYFNDINRQYDLEILRQEHLESELDMFETELCKVRKMKGNNQRIEYLKSEVTKKTSEILQSQGYCRTLDSHRMSKLIIAFDLMQEANCADGV